MKIELKLDDEAMADLAEKTHRAVVQMVYEVSIGTRRSAQWYVYHMFGQFYLCRYHTAKALVHITHTRRKGTQMYYFNDLAAPETDVWNAVAEGMKRATA